MLTYLHINIVCRLPGFHCCENSDCSRLACTMEYYRFTRKFRKNMFPPSSGSGRLSVPRHYLSYRWILQYITITWR